MFTKLYIVIVLLNLYNNVFVTSISQYPIIFIVSYDAFRYNYIDKGLTPTLSRLQREGTHAPYLENVFITKTFTNHHSIATGVYPEIHGVMGNNFFDPLLKKQINYSYEMWHYSDNILPIWIANEKKGGGRYSGVMMWPGNEYNYSGISPTYSTAWDGSVHWSKRIDVALSWILNPSKPANLVIMYIEEPDAHSHAFGPDSPQSEEELKIMDSVTKYILDKFEEHNLTNSINLFLLSDHGMESVSLADVVDLQKYVNNDKYDFYESSPTLHIYPKRDQANFVYNELKKAATQTKKFDVYKKSEIPEGWHYRENRRAPPILVLAKPPHVFHDFYANVKYQEQKFNFTATNDSLFGVHGYDNAVANMRPYFIAHGPAIKPYYTIQPFRTVDLYALWSHMGGFPELAAATNSSLKRVSPMLRVPERARLPQGANIAAGLFGVLLVAATMALAVFFVHKKLRARHRDFCSGVDADLHGSRQRLLNSDELENDT